LSFGLRRATGSPPVADAFEFPLDFAEMARANSMGYGSQVVTVLSGLTPGAYDNLKGKFGLVSCHRRSATVFHAFGMGRSSMPT
jgi:hypothetical protein